jgi:hypothetical protein
MPYGLSFESAIGDAAGVIFTIAKHPCLPEWAFAGQGITDPKGDIDRSDRTSRDIVSLRSWFLLSWMRYQ